MKRGKDKNLSNYASSIIETLKDPSKLIESNREAWNQIKKRISNSYRANDKYGHKRYNAT